MMRAGKSLLQEYLFQASQRPTQTHTPDDQTDNCVLNLVSPNLAGTTSSGAQIDENGNIGFATKDSSQIFNTLKQRKDIEITFNYGSNNSSTMGHT